MSREARRGTALASPFSEIPITGLVRKAPPCGPPPDRVVKRTHSPHAQANAVCRGTWGF